MLLRADNKERKSEVNAKVPASAPVRFLMKLDPVGVLIKESPELPKRANPAPLPV